MKKKSIRDLDIKGKIVLLRADFNVPLHNKRITDDTRIRATLPTLHHLFEQRARVVAMSHLGRPKGQVVDDLKLDPVARRLSELLEMPVLKANDCIGSEAKSAVQQLPPGGLLLLENLRFHSEEKSADDTFAAALASLGDCYVNDAFGAAHRTHASVVGIPKLLPSAAGFLLEQEMEYFSLLNDNPQRPYLAILGGAKVVDKIAVLKRLMKKVDSILIGGAMAYTFLSVRGEAVGESRVEPESMDIAAEIMQQAEASNVAFELPSDHVCADKFAPDASYTVCDEIAAGEMALDIGPKTVARYRDIIMKAKTVIWNGPMGVFEWDNFSKGTLGVATAVSEMKGISVVGGGDSLAALVKFGLEDEVTHASTGGGASLEFLEGKLLPGIEALPDA